jgi:CheY-like chemotaxis protein
MQKRIMLVDDESALRRSLSLSLNQFGYDVEPCENGLTALNKLDLYKKNDVNLDVVVLDLELPDINGKKLGRIIKSKYPDTAMFYITGYTEKLDIDEIEDLKMDGLLEKPFSALELTIEIQKALREKTKTEEINIIEKDDSKTVSAYALIKIGDQADFFSIYKKLYFMENVLYCDATRGDIDIFLLLQSDSIDQCREIFDNEIKDLEGIKNAEFLPIGIPILNENIREIINSAGITLFEDMPGMNKVRDNKKAVCSYVLVDIDREKLEDVYPVLRLTENILYCDYISGKYNLVLMIHGTQFSEIDKIIENKIITLNGVLKVKEYPIINIFEM